MTNSPNTPAQEVEDTNGLALWQLIYAAIAHEPLPLKVGQIEAAAKRVEDMLRRRASPAKPAVAGLPPLPHSLEDHIGEYWDIAHEEGRTGINLHQRAAPKWAQIIASVKQYGEQCRLAGMAQQQDTQQGEK